MQELGRTTELIFESRDLLAFYKEKGLATVPLKRKSEGDSLLTKIAENYPEVRRVKGANEWEGGIIHRLDTPTSGIVLCARNDKAYAELISAQKNNLIEKHYIASTTAKDNALPGFEAFPYSFQNSTLEITSFFRTYGEKGASVRPVLTNRRYQSGEKYTTTVRRTSTPDTYECIITKGFRHQIRAHLSWSGHPIIGDDRYGGTTNDSLLLEAVKVIFPFNGKTITIEV